ncbi:calcium/proton exchanger [Candidatus Methylospira mobilis]|uniref:Ca(2+)/H(+) antiporter n=1 Tax=Candidatus Methylospira mobilis TaxID=1808979 RepID=A0A5Q0BQ87_9GAMM|nr:calcium/proton exchanger [Candidatus Methylospira mobilis]QFY44364.1 calcium/proton exchanger [Candidatus Methylospira mobilis]
MGLKWLLVFIPVGIVLDWQDANPILVFATSALAIIPLASLVGDATEALARYLGPTMGGFLNATLGNAPEIIIGFFALKQGLVEMVKASITGSIIGNLLFGLGVSFLAANLKGHRKLHYDIESARTHGGLLMLAMFGLIVPAVFNFSTTSEREISLEISIVLFVIYLGSVILTFFPEKPKGEADDTLEIAVKPETPEQEESGWSRNKALAILISVTVTLAVMSEIMTDAVDPAAKSLGLTPLFVGVFLLAMVGNTAELFNAVRFARNGHLDLSVGITLGSSSQMALMVAPTLVFLGYYLGQDMNLVFSQFELIAVVMTVVAIMNMLQVGRLKRKAGALLVALYFMLGFGFFYAPASVTGG